MKPILRAGGEKVWALVCKVDFWFAILILAVYAMSYDLLMGYTGLLSFGHAMVFGGGMPALPIRALKTPTGSSKACRAFSWEACAASVLPEGARRNIW